MNAKVIATSFLGKRTSRLKTGYPQHSQDIRGPRDVFYMLEDILAYEQQVHAGIPVDTIVVLNGDSPYNKSIRQWDGRPTWNGTIKVIERENIGGSFGAYNHAFQLFKDEYDYFLFTEDDIVVGTDGYYLKLLQALEEETNLGFLALIERTDHPLGVHAHGGVGIAPTKVLRELSDKLGSLPHYKEEGWDKERVIREGEVPFTNEIARMGYPIGEFNPRKTWDFNTKLCIPYYDFKHEIR